MIFELAQDFHETVTAMPQEHPKRHMLELLEKGIRRDLCFVAEHPTTLFQCIWNSCSEQIKLNTFLQEWRQGKQHWTPDFRWLRLDQATQAADLHHRMIPLEGELTGVAVSADGCRTVVGSKEKIRLFDENLDRDILTIPVGSEFNFSTVAISADGSLLGCAQLSKESGVECVVFDVNCGRRTHVFYIPDSEVLSLTFSSDGKKLAACGISNRAGWLGVFDLQNNELLWERLTSGRLLQKVIFAHDNVNVIIAGGDGVCTIFSTKSGASRKDVRCHASGVSDINLSPSGDLVLCIGKDGVCQIWSTKIHWWSVRVSSVMESTPDSPIIAGIFLDESTIAVADFAGNVFHVSLSGNNSPKKILGCGRGMVQLCSANKGTRLVIAASGDQRCHVVDVKNALDSGGIESPRALAVDYTHDGHSVTISQYAGYIRSLDIAEPDWKQQLSQSPVSLGKPIVASAVSSSHFHLLVAQDGQWWLKDTVNKTDAQGQFSFHMEAGSIVSVSPDGRILCIFVREQVEFVTVDTGKREVFRLPMIPCAVRLSDDGTALILGRGCRFNNLCPRDVIAIWFNPLASHKHKTAGPFGTELAADGLNIILSGANIFMTSRPAKDGGCVVNQWNLMTLEQTSERRFSEPVKLLCLCSDCEQAAVYVPTLSECHIVDTTSSRLNDLWILPVANALDVASIRSTGDLVTTCDQQGTVSMFRAINFGTTTHKNKGDGIC